MINKQRIHFHIEPETLKILDTWVKEMQRQSPHKKVTRSMVLDILMQTKCGDPIQGIKDRIIQTQVQMDYLVKRLKQLQSQRQERNKERDIKTVYKVEAGVSL